MNENERIVCSVCSGHRKELHTKKSRLVKTTQLYLCNDCLKSQKEPRWLIILVSRSKGKDGPMFVLEYIKNHRYHGEPILAKELLANPQN